MTDADLQTLVRMLQADSPLHQLSNMEARAVFELLLQRGYSITKDPHFQTKGISNDQPR